MTSLFSTFVCFLVCCLARWVYYLARVRSLRALALLSINPSFGILVRSSGDGTSTLTFVWITGLPSDFGTSTPPTFGMGVLLLGTFGEILEACFISLIGTRLACSASFFPTFLP